MTVGVSAVVMLAATTYFSQQARAMRGTGFRVEAQQAARAAVDAVTRDVRLAGACLPINGTPVALDGVNDEAAGDRIVIRTGLVRNNLTCVTGLFTAATAVGANAFPVNDATGFIVGKMALAWNANSADGDLFRVTGVAGNTVRVDHGATFAYPVGSTLYAVDQRQYFLDRTRNPSLLMLQVDQQAPMPFAAGIDDLDFVYVLARNCPPCDQSDLSTPLSDLEWRLVNEVTVTVRARSIGGVLPTDSVSLTQSGRAKPRNLLQ